MKSRLLKQRSIPVVFCCVAFLLAACADSNEGKQTYSIATGGTGGLYYPIGGATASVWSKNLPHVNAKAEVTGGSVVNVIQVAKRESEFGFAMADVVTDAYLGTGRFNDPLPIRVLLNTYPNIVHIMTLGDSGISTVADLRGKRVSLGAAGSGTANTAENMLGALGLALDQFAPVFLNFAETTSALKDGTIAAGFVVGGLGLSSVTELAATRDIRLIALSHAEITTLLDAYPAYASYKIPANTYVNVETETQALGIWSSIVVHESFSTQLAMELLCTLFKHSDALTNVSPAAADMSAANLHQVSTVPLHPGTERYLQTLRANGSDPNAVICLE